MGTKAFYDTLIANIAYHQPGYVEVLDFSTRRQEFYPGMPVIKCVDVRFGGRDGTYRIGRSTIDRGFRRLAKGPVEGLSEESRRRLLWARRAELEGMVGFDDLEAIVDIGLFGRVNN